MFTEHSRSLSQASNILPNTTRIVNSAPARKHGPTLLIVDDEEGAHERLNCVFANTGIIERGIQILHATSIMEAQEVLSEHTIHVVLLDKTLESRLNSSGSEDNGIEAIPDLLRIQPHLQVLVLTGSHDIPDVVRAMNLGAFNYVTKDTPDELLASQIERALHVSLLKLDKERAQRIAQQNEIMNPVQLGGKSRVFRNLLKKAETFSRGNAPILLLGPTGSGKSELARWIHDQRCIRLNQKDLPFQPVNVANLPRTIIESELFGHERSAFTDAKQMKRGLFEIVQNGTLFLDEIGELPLDLQSRLLLVIGQGIFNRIGSAQIMKSHARLILATNRDLKKMVEAGTFREDLYDRICGLTLEMPSLEERREDIPDIMRVMLPQVCQTVDIQVKFEDLPSDFIEYMQESKNNKNLRALRDRLQLFLLSVPRDPKDNPVFTRWRSVDGFLEGGNAPTLNGNARTPLTYAEFKSRNRSWIGEGFPGIQEFLDELKQEILEEAKQRFTKQRDMAKALGLKESTFSMWIKNQLGTGRGSKEAK